MFKLHFAETQGCNLVVCIAQYYYYFELCKMPNAKILLNTY